MFSLSNTSFQTKSIDMNFSHVNFNYHSRTQSKQNLEFAEALEDRVIEIYNTSWIGQYFDIFSGTDDYIVSFFESKNTRSNSYRFKIYLYIPKKTKPYFYPLSEWKKFCPISECAVLTENISHVNHGFKTTSYPSTKSVYYTYPYFLVFKSPTSISNNYLIFNDFLKPNFETRILAMLVYDEEKNLFLPYFSPGITLPFLKTISLSKTLEFILVDANKKQILLEDYSQLFISLTLKN